MKKFLLSALVIVSFVFYALGQRLRGYDSVSATTPSVSNGNGFSMNTRNKNPGMGMMNSRLKDGEYTGVSADAYYGNVQVGVVVQNGKIIQVQFLDYPHDRRTSQEINGQAMPMLQSEAIQAQSANVDVVSGATDTSQAFRQSLQSALLQAQS